MDSCTSTTCIYGRTNVPSVIRPESDILICCEAPGYKEIQQMQPLVGPAGVLFNRLIGICGLERTDLSLANTCGCVDLKREDRRPLPAEIEACRPRLLDDIERADPKLILAMGNVALSLFFPGMRIGQAHGKLRNFEGRVVMAAYHPAAALPFRNPELQQVIIEDISKALGVMRNM